MVSHYVLHEINHLRLSSVLMTPFDTVDLLRQKSGYCIIVVNQCCSFSSVQYMEVTFIKAFGGMKGIFVRILSVFQMLFCVTME